MSVIAARYQLIGPAQTGAPQRARDLETAQTVWLRSVQLPKEKVDAALARAQAAQRIFHPALVTLFDVVLLPDNRLLLAYEFVPSQSLAEASAGQTWNARRAAEIVSEVADALAEIHARRLTHGDVSQATVLLTLKGKAKLDRLADPTLPLCSDGDGRDLVAVADLLGQLVGNQTSAGMMGTHAIEVLVERGRSGKIESAATFAALLRRLIE